MENNYKRGEIYCLNWNPGRGSEQGGSRLVLIIQNDIGNKYSPNTIVASMTTAVPVGNSYPFIVVCSPRDSGMDRMNAIDLASIMTVSGSMLGDKCGQLSAAKMLEVNEAIKNSLGLV
jgi:mRNA interferase MazF